MEKSKQQKNKVRFVVVREFTRRWAIGLALPTREQVEALAASEACRVTCLPLDSMP